MHNDVADEREHAGTVTLECRRTPVRVAASARAGQVALQFGLPLQSAVLRIFDGLRVTIRHGGIVLVLGPSGSGKSTALDLIARKLPGGHCVRRVTFPRDRAVIDAVCPHLPLARALELLSACGFAEAPHWVRTYGELSDGQRFRARLARAVGRHLRSASPAPLICDEFASGLHRRLAKSVAFNLRKLVSRHGLSLVLASSNDDIVADLQPDVIVHLSAPGRHRVVEHRPRRRPISFRRRLDIVPGAKRDYDSFASMHYRPADELGFVDKVFVLRVRVGGEPLGIVVYAHGPIELALRNRSTRRRFLRNPKRLNREMRIIRRIVIHPDVRGCGLGHFLLRKTMPRVGTRYIECLASMGAVNPVFEKAGMKRIGTCALPESRAKTLDALDRLGVDPFDRAFVTHVCRRPRVRRIVTGLVQRWYQATTAGGEKRVERQAPDLLAQLFRGLVGARPVYFLWQRPAGRRQTGEPR